MGSDRGYDGRGGTAAAVVRDEAPPRRRVPGVSGLIVAVVLRGAGHVDLGLSGSGVVATRGAVGGRPGELRVDGALIGAALAFGVTPLADVECGFACHGAVPVAGRCGLDGVGEGGGSAVDG